MNGKSDPFSTSKANSQNGTEKYIVIVENLNDWKKEFPVLKVITVNDYLSQPSYIRLKDAKIINLSKSYRYLSRGYFCSLLAEARRHRIIPSVRTLRDLSKKSIYKIDIDTDELDNITTRVFRRSKDKHGEKDTIEIYVFFRLSDNPHFETLAEEIFDTFRCPLLKVEFEKEDEKWEISSIKALTLNTIPQDKTALFVSSIAKYTKKRWITPRLSRLKKLRKKLLK